MQPSKGMLLAGQAGGRARSPTPWREHDACERGLWAAICKGMQVLSRRAEHSTPVEVRRGFIDPRYCACFLSFPF